MGLPSDVSIHQNWIGQQAVNKKMPYIKLLLND